MNTRDIIEEIAEYESGAIDAQDLARALQDYASDLQAIHDASLDSKISDQEIMRKQHSLSREELGL